MRSTQRASALALSALLLGACATTPTDFHRMPAELSEARSPARADPDRPAQLAEAALHLLDPERPGGPDHAAAARMCLLASDVADPGVERDLRRACHRVAARSALRSGDRDLYIEAVSRWEEAAPRTELAAGELAVHLAIRDRLNGTGFSGRVPRDLRRLLPPPDALEARR